MEHAWVGGTMNYTWDEARNYGYNYFKFTSSEVIKHLIVPNNGPTLVELLGVLDQLSADGWKAKDQDQWGNYFLQRKSKHKGKNSALDALTKTED